MSKFAPHHRSTGAPRATSSTVCQKCLGTGHYTYQCKATATPYVSRPSRTQQLENPRLLQKLRQEGRPSVEVPDEFKSKSGTANRILEANEKEREKKKSSEKPPKKRTRRNSSSDDSASGDEDSDSTSDTSGSSSDSGSDSDSSSSSSDSSRSRSRSSGSSRHSRRRRAPARRMSGED